LEAIPNAPEIARWSMPAGIGFLPGRETIPGLCEQMHYEISKIYNTTRHWPSRLHRYAFSNLAISTQPCYSMKRHENITGRVVNFMIYSVR